MELGEAELPSSPEELIVRGDHAGEFAFDGAHGEGEGDDLDAGGEGEASVDGSVDGDGVAEGELLWQVVYVPSGINLRQSSHSAARFMTEFRFIKNFVK